jgi:hypothetical protein
MEEERGAANRKGEEVGGGARGFCGLPIRRRSISFPGAVGSFPGGD